MAVTVNIPVASIIVGDRRREEYGAVDELAASIERYGLLHPIVVDMERNLVAGGRRLAAVQHLGMEHIAVRMLDTLSPAERREIELEENLQRKDLTSYELSKELAALAETAAEVLREMPPKAEVGFLPTIGKNPEDEGAVLIHNESKPQDASDGGFRTESVRNLGGRPSKPDSERAVANRIGKPASTIRDARQHVEVAERYPILKNIPTQADALKIAAKLDAMPEPVRAETLERITNRDSETLTTLTDRPPVEKGPTPHELAANDPERKWAQAITTIREKIHAAQQHGGISHLTRKWSMGGKRDYLRQIRQIRAELGEWEAYLAEEVEHDEHVA